MAKEFKSTNELIELLNEKGVSIKDENKARYLIEIAKSYSAFYNENKIICEDKDIQNARVYLTYCVGKVLKQGAELLGMEMPEKMFTLKRTVVLWI